MTSAAEKMSHEPAMMTEGCHMTDRQKLYSADPAQRVQALATVSETERVAILDKFGEWPKFSPGTLNAWAVFLGPSPGASPGSMPWDYDPRPSIAGPHPGFADYVDTKGFWNGMRAFARELFPELKPREALAAVMLRNFVTEMSATAPRGEHMRAAGPVIFRSLDLVVKPRLVLGMGGVLAYSDPLFLAKADPRTREDGALRTARKGDPRRWFSVVGRWSTGEPYLYVSAKGIHPSLFHVSKEDTHAFLVERARVARGLS